MPLLDALLAFVLIIFAVSMATTVVVQVCLGLSKKRLTVFERMLGDYCMAGLVPAVRARIEERGFELYDEEDEGIKHRTKKCKVELAKQVFCDDMAGLFSPAVDGGSDALKMPRSIVADISRDAFAARLKASSLGRRIAEAVEAFERRQNAEITDADLAKAVDAFFAELAARFDVFAARASEAYRRCARRASIIAGLSVAFAVNIDGLNTIQQLVGDPALRTAIVASDKETIDSLKSIERSLSAVKPLLAPKRMDAAADSIEKAAKGIEQATKSVLAQEAGERTAFSKDMLKLSGAANQLTKQLQEVEQKLAKSKLFVDDTASDLRAAIAAADLSYGGALAIGWNGWPVCTVETDKRCALERGSLEGVLAYVFWLLGVVFTGLLAGLGAPFWYDLIKAVSRAWRVSRNPGQVQ